MGRTRIISGDVNTSAIGNAHISTDAFIDTAKLADGSISNAEFQRLNGVGSSVAGISDSATLTNKIMTGVSNWVAAGVLIAGNGSTFVNISGAVPPSNGQVLTAVGTTGATWQTPSGGLTVSNFVYNEVPLGLVNGVNDRYTTANTFTANTLRVYKNGLRMLTGDAQAGSNDYYVTGTTGFVFQPAQIPQTNDNLQVDYMK